MSEYEKKTSGFFIVEILIVLVIIGILTLALLPNLRTYILRAKFSDNIAAGNSRKAVVEVCALKQGLVNGTAPAAPFNSCVGGANGIPPNVYGYGGYVKTVEVNQGVIHVISTSVFDGTDVFGFSFGSPGNTAYNYQLTPTATNGIITWQNTGNCRDVGLC